MNEQIIFLIFAVIMLSILLWQVCKKENLTYKLLFFFTLIILSAVYLFQFGELGSFIFSSKWADVKFIKEKKEEARQDAEIINTLRRSIESQAKELSKAVQSVKKSENDIDQVKNSVIGIEGDLVKLERGLVEIQYLTYIGRNVFPNPYHERIMDRLNELLIIAIPDTKQRAIVVKELEEYSRKKRNK
ncbi:MAG: hypothetical protein ABIK53_07570 [bacterium]